MNNPQIIKLGTRVRVSNVSKTLEGMGGRFAPFEGVLTGAKAFFGEVTLDNGEVRVIDALGCHIVEVITEDSSTQTKEVK
jgi:hypothetical protein